MVTHRSSSSPNVPVWSALFDSNLPIQLGSSTAGRGSQEWRGWCQPKGGRLTQPTESAQHRPGAGQSQSRQETGAGTAVVGASGRGQEPRARPQSQEEEGWDMPVVKGSAGHALGRARLQGQGAKPVRGSQLRPTGPSPDLLSSAFLSPGNEAGTRVPWRQKHLGKGSPLLRVPGFKLRWAGSCLLEPWREQRGTESWGLCQTQSSFPRRMPPEGRREEHMEKQQLPRRRCRRGHRSSTVCCPGPRLGPVLFPLVPSRDGNWDLCSLALCGLQQWALGPSRGVSE